MGQQDLSPARRAAGSASVQPLTLVLFDIDGTLLHIHGAGKAAFRGALHRVFGWEDDLAYINFAGSTDLIVLDRIMTEQGHTRAPGDEERLFAALAVELEKAVADAHHTLYPGVMELLRALHADDRVLLGLVTGNIRPCAHIKLRRFDLHHFFSFGGFGDEHVDRSELARRALVRAQEQLGPGQVIERVYLVGDSPADVAAAAAVGAVSVAVATGTFSPETLAASGANHVLADLSRTAEVLSVLGLE